MSNKLTETGRLYLKEFYILELARHELFDYLNAVVDGVKANLEQYIGESSQSSKYRWNVWSLKANPGNLDFGISPVSKSKELSQRKISILYKDIRHTEKLDEPSTIMLSAWSPAAANQFKDEVKKIDKDLYKPDFILLNLDDTEESIERIIARMLEKYDQVNNIMSQLDGSMG